jgi:hypothetical protein
MLTSDGADADAAEREDAGRNRGLADHFDDFAHVDDGIEIGGIFDCEMRHGVIAPDWRPASAIRRMGDAPPKRDVRRSD